MRFEDKDIVALREEVKKRLSPQRFTHTLGVEAEAAALGNLYLPQFVDELRVAALLHDITKVGKNEEQYALCKTLGIEPTQDEKEAPQVLHGRTAAALIPLEFPQYATPQVISAVSRHTTGDRGMSVFDMIIFLADYIEATRTHASCRRMREMFWQAPQEVLCTEIHLKRIVLKVLEDTLAHLRENNTVIDARTLATYQWLVEELGMDPK